MRSVITPECSLLVVLVGSLLAGCGGEQVARTSEGVLVPGAFEEVRVEERVISVGARTLVLDGFAGTVDIRASSDDVAHLQVRLRARGQSQEAARDLALRMAMNEEGDPQRFVYRLTSPSEERSRVDVFGTIPRGTPLEIKWSRGDIVVQDLSGRVRVDNRNGNVRIQRSIGPVLAQTRNGDIDVSLGANARTAQITATTANGNLTVAVPPQAGAHISATTATGLIRTGDLPFLEESLSATVAGGSFSARLGQTEGLIEISALNGDLAILRSTEAPAFIDEAGKEEATPGESPDALAPDTAGLDTSGAAESDLSSDTKVMPYDSSSVPKEPEKIRLDVGASDVVGGRNSGDGAADGAAREVKREDEVGSPEVPADSLSGRPSVPESSSPNGAPDGTTSALIPSDCSSKEYGVAGLEVGLGRSHLSTHGAVAGASCPARNDDAGDIVSPAPGSPVVRAAPATEKQVERS